MRADLRFQSDELEAQFSKLQAESNLRLTKQVCTTGLLGQGPRWGPHSPPLPASGAACFVMDCKV